MEINTVRSRVPALTVEPEELRGAGGGETVSHGRPGGEGISRLCPPLPVGPWPPDLGLPVSSIEGGVGLTYRNVSPDQGQQAGELLSNSLEVPGHGRRCRGSTASLFSGPKQLWGPAGPRTGCCSQAIALTVPLGSLWNPSDGQ